MNTADQPAEHLIVEQDVFAGDRFWAALDRLAARQGHDDHQRMLRGATEPSNAYEFRCLSCQRTIATMEVRRTAATG